MIKYNKILIIGAGGGREHALGWKIAQSERAGKLFFARGNAGTAQIGTNLDIKETDTPALLGFAKSEGVDLTLVVSDDALAAGVVDAFTAFDMRVWGPTKAASELEWSKAYAKDFMTRHHLPTARHQVFTDFEGAKAYVEKGPVPVVIKASGLALGKGVTVAQSKEEAINALHKILVDKVFGSAGNEVIIEEYLAGIEISIHAISDGTNYKIFPASQDHKRILDGDIGPNTGGMGTIAPLSFIMPSMMNLIEKEIITPTIKGMREEGREFKGCLYPGIMITLDGPKVFEFNSRFGDPETQTYMRILETDFLDIIDASIDGTLNNLNIGWKNEFACNIALASGGYPNKYEKGKVVTGLEEAQRNGNIVIFHSGTTLDEKKNLVTNGGRVLGVSATGLTLKKALSTSYEAISKIHFEGMQFRKDIGQKALGLER
ncbi:MAG: phosphoribosylamine--glycine ligase [Patescibacteria group bacterium]